MTAWLADSGAAAQLRVYRRGAARRRLAILLMATALAALICTDLVTGPSSLRISEAVDALFYGMNRADSMAATIIWSFRLPTTLMGALVGISLGIAGLQMQTILDNPLASPFTLGFSAAAGFGAALAIMYGAAVPLVAWLLVPLSAFSATLIACGLIYLIARFCCASAEVLVLGGIAVMFMFQAFQALLQYLASPEVLQQIVFWLFGSLQRASWTSIAVVGFTLLICLPVLLIDAWRLTALRLGDVHARSLGVKVDRLRCRTFIIIALLTASAVAFVGTIGFVGLVAPHAARALVGEDQRALLPLSALTGGIMLSGASVVSKLIAQGAVVPIGIVTAIVGVPILFMLIIRRGMGG
ncbi:iron ABC transporter permease [Affinibrenneria salicis]|uniref:Iron ABC transporter permease n=1 Tax=Affinibrenneria salicis TaxID=2590031 RepID=A0A5J5G4U2_9GAMM|nr:iron ABC transporter permease [Affinibrenneria salicis]KAA9002028.1 iron ABC transporter permease [Affinibrenneria salicis]